MTGCTYARARAQVLQTNRRITRAGNTVWQTTKRTTDRALDRPKKLLARFHGGAKGADDACSDDGMDGAALEPYKRVLLPPPCRCMPVFALASRSSGSMMHRECCARAPPVGPRGCFDANS